jgi:hypothetical protein
MGDGRWKMEDGRWGRSRSHRRQTVDRYRVTGDGGRGTGSGPISAPARLCALRVSVFQSVRPWQDESADGLGFETRRHREHSGRFASGSRTENVEQQRSPPAVSSRLAAPTGHRYPSTVWRRWLRFGAPSPDTCRTDTRHRPVLGPPISHCCLVYTCDAYLGGVAF